MSRGRVRGDICRFRCSGWPQGVPLPESGHVFVSAGGRWDKIAPKHRKKWVVVRTEKPKRVGKTLFIVVAMLLGPEDPIAEKWSFWTWDRQK